MSALVVNLTRFGDLLQSQPAITALAKAHGGVELVCVENFAGTAALLQGVTRVHALPGSGLLADLDANWTRALARLADYTQGVGADHGPCVNLTANLSARLLTRLLTKAPLGFGVDGHGFSANSSAWASFLELSSQHRGLSPFNIVDLFWRCAHLSGRERPFDLKKPPPEQVEAMRAHCRAAVPEAKGFVALQLGASQDRRRWPVAHFAGLADILWQERNWATVLTGAASEGFLAERFQALNKAPSVNFVGRTNLSELASVLTACLGLVSNDTGTMHLAAGLGLPILAIFLATAQPFDTGPYREGSLSLEPETPCHPCAFGSACKTGHHCRQLIPAACVAHYLTDLLDGAPARVIPSPVRVWRSERDEDGFMDLAAVSAAPSDRASWMRLSRLFYKALLDERELGRPRSETPLSPSFAARTAGVIEATAPLLELLDGQSKLLAATASPMAKTKFMATWQRLAMAWQDEPAFGVLGSLWTHLSQMRPEPDQVAALGLRIHGLLRDLRPLVAPSA